MQHKLLYQASNYHIYPYNPQPRPNNSGFQSFLKWFKKNERDRLHQNPIHLNSSRSANNGFIPNGHANNCIYDSSDTLSPPSSISSSCDSIYSTATTGFAFIPPNQYKPYGNACQVIFFFLNLCLK